MNKKRTCYPSWQRRHEGVLQYLLEHPWVNQKDCAIATGYTPSQISRITNSSDFKLRYQEAMNLQLRELIQRRLACQE